MMDKLPINNSQLTLESDKMTGQSFDGKISIIMPAYNEGKRIRSSLRDLELIQINICGFFTGRFHENTCV